MFADRFILRCASVALACFGLLVARADVTDYERRCLWQQDLTGSARYVGMAGAMGAVGADPSAVLDNPAGLGLYRRTEVAATLGWQQDQVRVTDMPSEATRWSLDQISWNFSSEDPTRVVGLVANNVMLSYSRLTNYARDCYMRDNTGDCDMLEGGFTDQYNVGWGMNISRRWYLGVNMAIHYANYWQEVNFWADDAHNSSRTSLNGVGFRASAGFLFRPVPAFRFGAAIHTPSHLALSGHFYDSYLDAESGRPVSDEFSEQSSMRLPLRVHTGAMYQWGKRCMLAATYDYHYDAEHVLPASHTVRLGGEVVVAHNWFILAGAACQLWLSDEQTWWITTGLSYRNRHFVLGAAYQCRLHDYENYISYDGPRYPVESTTHRVTISLAWHRAR